MNPYPIPPVEPIYKETNHLLHFILTVITFGVWGVCCWWPVAMIVNSTNSSKRERYRRDLAEYHHQVRLLEGRHG